MNKPNFYARIGADKFTPAERKHVAALFKRAEYVGYACAGAGLLLAGILQWSLL